MFDRTGSRRGGWLLVRASTWRSCRPKLGAVPVTGAGEVGHELDGPDPGELSEIGSSERENERLEGVEGTETSCGSDEWPSDTDCLRAWGCLEEIGSDADLARGDEMRGDVGAVKRSVPCFHQKQQPDVPAMIPSALCT